MANALNSNTSTPSSGGDVLLNYFPGSTDKNDAYEAAPTSIKFGGDVANKEEKIAKAKDKLQEAIGEVSQNGEHIKDFTDVEDIVSSKKIRITNPAAQKALSNLAQEVSHQLTNLQGEAPILEDQDSLKKIFTLAAMSVDKDDTDVVKIKNEAIEAVKKITKHTSRAKIPTQVKNLLFANDGSQFLDGLRKLIRSEGLKSISRGADGGVGTKLIKMVRGFGPLQESASIALMTKIDQLLTGSPDQELIDGLDTDMKNALFSLRDTITKDFTASSEAAIAKKEADLDLMEPKDAAAARENITKIREQRDIINNLFNAKSSTEYSKYQQELVERVLETHADIYEVDSAMADIKEAKDKLKEITRGSDADQTFFQLPTYLMEGAELNLKLEYFRSLTQDFKNGKPDLPPVTTKAKAEKQVEVLDIIADIKEQMAGQDSGSITIGGVPTSINQLNAIIDKVEKDPDSPDFSKAPAQGKAWKNIEKAVRSDLTDKIVAESQKAHDTAAQKYEKIMDMLNANPELKKLLAKDSDGDYKITGQDFVESLNESSRTALDKGMEDLIKSQGVWSLMLSKQDETQIDRIKDLLTDANTRYSVKDTANRSYGDLEYKILYAPLGKKAETVAAAVRNGLNDYMMGEEGEGLPENARSLYIKKTKDLLRARQEKYLNDAVDAQKFLIEHGGMTKHINKEIETTANLAGIKKADLDLKNAFAALESLANPPKDASDEAKRIAKVFETTNSSERRIMKADYIQATDTPGKKAEKEAERLTLLLGKLNDASKRNEVDKYLQEFFKSNPRNSLKTIYESLERNREELMPKVDKLENVSDMIKEQKKALKELRQERDAWGKTGSDTTIFGFKKAGAFIKSGMEYMHGIVTRLFTFTAPEVKQKEEERLTKNLEVAKQGLEADNTLDEAILAGISNANSISEVARLSKAKDRVDSIIDYRSSARAAA
jgi:hypothetical protein